MHRRDGSARRRKDDIGIAEVEIGQITGLQDLGVAERHLFADGAFRRQRHHLVDREGALRQDLQHLAADIAGRPNHCHTITHRHRLHQLAAPGLGPGGGRFRVAASPRTAARGMQCAAKAKPRSMPDAPRSSDLSMKPPARKRAGGMRRP